MIISHFLNFALVGRNYFNNYVKLLLQVYKNKGFVIFFF